MNLLAAVTFADGIGMDDLTWLAGLISVISVIVGAVWALLRPQGGRVTLRLNPISRVTASGNRANLAAGTFVTVPAGFATPAYASLGAATVNGIPDGHISAGGGSGTIGVICPSGTWTADQLVWAEVSYTTDESWPSSLPGTA